LTNFIKKRKLCIIKKKRSEIIYSGFIIPLSKYSMKIKLLFFRIFLLLYPKERLKPQCNNKHRIMATNSFSKKFLKRGLIFILVIFVFVNIFVAIQAYSSTHFHEQGANLQHNDILSNKEIAQMLITGVKIIKPRAHIEPNRKYKSIKIKSEENKFLSAWVLQTDSVHKGSVILFHGYKDEKSMFLNYAYELLDMGYNTILVDFMGSGDSYGLQSTIGYKEAENVKTTFDYVANELKEEKIYMLGFSMGAAAITKALYDYNLPAKGLIIEAAYGRMFDTVKIRLSDAGIMSYPMAGLFCFWGSVFNGINAFKMNPEEYVRQINVPALIACGGRDQYIPQSETQRIFNNLASKNKILKFYPEAKHELYIGKYPDEWKKTVRDFLDTTHH